VEVNGRKQYFVLWSKLSNAHRWYKYGMDVKKTIAQLVTSNALAYYVMSQYDDKDRETESTTLESWVHVVNFHLLEKDK